MKLLLENWREYLNEGEDLIVYRGIPDFVYDKYLETGQLPLTKDIIPKDSEVMNYAIERGFDEKTGFPQWAKEATTGINATTDRENAEGYGKVITMKVIGDDYVELPGGYVFIKDYDQVEVIDNETPT